MPFYFECKNFIECVWVCKSEKFRQQIQVVENNLMGLHWVLLGCSYNYKKFGIFVKILTTPPHLHIIHLTFLTHTHTAASRKHTRTHMWTNHFLMVCSYAVCDHTNFPETRKPLRSSFSTDLNIFVDMIGSVFRHWTTANIHETRQKIANKSQQQQ